MGKTPVIFGVLPFSAYCCSVGRLLTMNERGNCRACHRVVLWAVTDKSKNMPVDPGETEDGNLTLFREGQKLRVTVVEPGTGKFLPHFATCEKRVAKVPVSA
jgi:hypothetical protein